MKKRKDKTRKSPPVVTGYDGRPERRDERGSAQQPSPSAPDGVSGNWE